MKTALSFIFVVALSAIAAPVFSQSEKLTEADYNTALAKGLESTSARDRRVVTTEKFYSGPELKGERRIVSVFGRPDAKKIMVSEEFGEKKSKKDAVGIGGQFFCRDGKEEWKRSDKNCSEFGKLTIPAGDYEYSVESDTKDPSRKTYIRRATFVDSGSAKQDAVRLKFIEIKFIADEYGIIEYNETRRGGIEPNGWGSTQVTRYEYDPKDLKIDR